MFNYKNIKEILYIIIKFLNITYQSKIIETQEIFIFAFTIYS